MRFIKKYNNFKLILENKEQALSILRKKNISKKDKNFLEISELLEDKFNNLNFLGLLTKYRFTQGTSQDEIKDLIKWLHDNKGAKLLKKPLMQYKFFEELKDEIIQIDMRRKIKLVIDELPRQQKDIYRNASENEKEIFDGWSVKMFDIKYKKPFFDKISQIRTFDELIDYISKFVQQNLDIKSFQEKMDEIESIDGANIFKVEEDNGIIAARIDNFAASKKLGSSSWCISTGITSWSSYVYNKQAYQYFVWNYSLSPADPLFMIGVTVGTNDRIMNIHDMNDRGLMKNIPTFIKELELKGMTSEEFLERRKSIRDDKREEAKRLYEEDPDLVVYAESLQSYLENENMWIDAYDIYDLIPESYDHYGLKQFNIDLPEEEMQFAIGTDSECDDAAYLYQENLWDELNTEAFNPSFIERFIDGESLADELLADEEDYLRDLITEDPDFYEVKAMTDDQRTELEELEEKKYQLEQKLDQLNDSDDWDLDKENELEEEIENIQDRIDELENQDNWDIDEDLVDEKVKELYDDRRQEVINDPVEYLKGLGYTSHRTQNQWGRTTRTIVDIIEGHIDKQRMFEEIIEEDGRGNTLSGYDGEERSVTYAGTDYYIYRTD